MTVIAVWHIAAKGYPEFKTEARSVKEARANFRRWHGIRVMPSGATTWRGATLRKTGGAP